MPPEAVSDETESRVVVDLTSANSEAPDPHADLRVLFDQETRVFLGYMDLKFRHFVTFVTLNGALLAGAFSVEALTAWRPALALAGVFVVSAFWALDERTGAYLRTHLIRSQNHMARLLPAGVEVPRLPGPSRLGATRVTRALFTMFLAAWVVIEVVTLAG